jgi:hypothetical protein
MKTLTSPPALRKRTLALAVSSLLCAPFASVHAANPPLVAGPGEHLIASGDYDSSGVASLQAFGGGSITTSGPVSVVNTLVGFPGVSVTDAGSLIDLRGSSITSVGTGAAVSSLATLKMDSTAINVTSNTHDHIRGVYAQDASQVILTNSNITVSNSDLSNGAGSVSGLSVNSGSTLTANAVDVLATGTFGGGMVVTDSGSRIDFEDGTVTSTAGSAQASNSASLNIRNTPLTTTGSGAFGSTGVAMTDAYTGTTVLQDVNIISPAPKGTPGWLVDGVGDALHMYESNNQNTNRSSLTTNADFSNAIQVANGASALLEYTNLVTNGYGSAGLAVDGSG